MRESLGEFRIERRLGFFVGLRLGASRLLNGCYLNRRGFRKTPTGFEKLSKDDKDSVRQRLYARDAYTSSLGLKTFAVGL